jgi:hypothetical protein
MWLKNAGIEYWGVKKINDCYLGLLQSENGSWALNLDFLLILNHILGSDLANKNRSILSLEGRFPLVLNAES